MRRSFVFFILAVFLLQSGFCKGNVFDSFVKVGGGAFEMGSADKDAPADEALHEVFVDDFCISKYEVTRSLYKKVTGKQPSYFSCGGTCCDDPTLCPVENITFQEAIEFCNFLSRKEKLEECYIKTDGENWKWVKAANGYRLPTEAEWEFAARGGKLSHGYRYAGSDKIGDVAWYSGNSNGFPHQVGKKEPNELGLYDMTGNVWEFCWDIYGTYDLGQNKNPDGAEKGRNRVRRGGGFIDVGSMQRVSCREQFRQAYYAGNFVGFRLARNAER